MNLLEAFSAYAEKGPDIADEAWAVVNSTLDTDPDSVDAQVLGARIQYDAGHFGLADTMLRRALQNKPDHSGAWVDLGRVVHLMQKSEMAAKYFTNALRITGDRFVALNNLLLINNTLGRPEKTVELAPLAKFLCSSPSEAEDLNGNYGIACLMLRKWKEGWINYEGLIRPNNLRAEIKYEKDGVILPRWDGTPGGEVIVTGEQGLGDEKLFASMIPDMISGGTTPIIHCDRRLEGLFKRSFDCPVYGGRGKKNSTGWLKDHNPKASIQIGSLGKFYRNSDEDFPRRPYLKADPEKRIMCRALLDQWPGRKIGIAWTGGTKKNRAFDRSVSLEELQPLLDIPGITWVSLEYKGEDPGRGIKHVPFITQSQDYDDTAALVAELDGVVSVTTSVAFLAGALGVDCHVMVPEAATWHWPKTPGEYPWFPVKTYRRNGPDWTQVIEDVKGAIA